MARTPARPIVDPKLCVLSKGRFYVQNGKYPQISFFSIFITEIDIVQNAFGGKYYRHNKGWIWVLARRQDILKLLEVLAPDILPGAPLDKATRWYKERETAD